MDKGMGEPDQLIEQVEEVEEEYKQIEEKKGEKLIEEEVKE